MARLVGVCSDVTLRKTAEDQLRRVNESLEVKVFEHTAQLEDAHRTVLEEVRQREHTEKLLRQVQKLEMIGQLTGGIAHDFNNLLMAIMANLELVRKEVPPEERVGRLVDGALKGAQRGAALTQRLLAFARQQVLKVVEPVQMSTLVHGMADLLDRSIGSMIELVIDTPPEAPFTRVDTNQVELAILNLVVNARDAMPDGGAIHISVDTAHSTGDSDLRAGDYVRVTVRDTGTGMDATTLAKATEPFFTTTFETLRVSCASTTAACSQSCRRVVDHRRSSPFIRRAAATRRFADVHDAAWSNVCFRERQRVFTTLSGRCLSTAGCP